MNSINKLKYYAIITFDVSVLPIQDSALQIMYKKKIDSISEPFHYKPLHIRKTIVFRNQFLVKVISLYLVNLKM